MPLFGIFTEMCDFEVARSRPVHFCKSFLNFSILYIERKYEMST